MNLPELTDLQRLNLQPGDRLIFRFPGKLTRKQTEEIRQRLRGWAGDFPVLVLDQGGVLDVVTADGEQEIVR